MIKKIILKLYHLFRGDDIPTLRKRGVHIGQNVFIGSDVIIDPDFAWLISIADDCSLTNRVIILAHDASTKRHIGYTKVGRVSIGKKTFIGMASIILPGITIGENVIIGAGSVVTKDIPDNSIAVGNPATVIGFTSEYVKSHIKNMETMPVFNEGWTLKTEITEENKKNMFEMLKNGNGYII